MLKRNAVFQQFLSDRSGAAGSEYAICLGLIVVAVLALLASFGGLSSTVQTLSDLVTPRVHCSDGDSIAALQARPN